MPSSRLIVQKAENARHQTETVKLRKAGSIIISDTARAPASSQAGDWHDVSGHHRYYGSSACNGGERIVETRRGPRSHPVNVCGF
jgi:hypothetical protein